MVIQPVRLLFGGRFCPFGARRDSRSAGSNGAPRPRGASCVNLKREGGEKGEKAEKGELSPWIGHAHSAWGGLLFATCSVPFCHIVFKVCSICWRPFASSLAPLEHFRLMLGSLLDPFWHPFCIISLFLF